MAFDVEAAKAAGYTQEEINAYLQGQPKTKVLAPVAPGQEVDPGEPPPPTTTVTPAGEGSWAPGVATAVVGAAPYVLPAVGAGAAALGGGKLYGAWKESAEAAKALADAKMASEQGIAQRAAQRMGGMPKTPISTAGMPNTPVPTYNVPTQTIPSVAQTPPPSAATAAAQEAQQIRKANSIVRNLALSKLLGPAAVAAGGAAATGLAGAQMGAMTPQQRQGFYSSPMLGAMGGDAGLAAAIMNQGQ